MFIGSVPKEARLIIQEILKEVPKDKECWIGCSGNFTIDKLCNLSGRVVHGNDVSLYSKLIADIVMGEKERTITGYTDDIYKDIFDVWPDSVYKDLISVMFVMNIAEFEKQDNAYKATNYENLILHHQSFHDNTLAKFDRMKPFEFKLNSFYFGDFREHLKNCKGVGFVFAPTYTGGYEKLYTRIEGVFEYERADYDLFDSKEAGAVYAELMEDKELVVYSDNIFSEISNKIVGKVKMPEGRKDIFIYSSVGKPIKKMLLKAKINIPESKILTLPSDFKFGQNTKITAKAVSVKEVNYFKHFYMGAKVDYSEGGDFGVIFYADGYAFEVDDQNEIIKDRVKLLLENKLQISLINRLRIFLQGLTYEWNNRPTKED